MLGCKGLNDLAIYLRISFLVLKNGAIVLFRFAERYHEITNLENYRFATTERQTFNDAIKD